MGAEGYPRFKAAVLCQRQADVTCTLLTRMFGFKAEGLQEGKDKCIIGKKLMKTLMLA